MSYEAFLSEFAKAHGIEDAAHLLADHAERYAFQIQSRERAKGMIAKLRSTLDIDFRGKRVLDVGCAYGSFAIELAHAGAKPVGIDISDKWLKLAEVNAQDDVEVKFLNCDASSYLATNLLAADGPYDFFVINDVLEHIYDTAGLLSNLAKLSAPDAKIYFKVPNGLATRHVLQEGHKKQFAISLLPPDYWSEFVEAPFHIYYRRWQYFEALFSRFGFSTVTLLNQRADEDIEQTKRFIINDVNRIRRQIKLVNFANPKQYGYIRNAARYYYEEVRQDLDTLPWDELHHKYRVTFWEGVARR